MSRPGSSPTFGASVAEAYERDFVPLIPAPLAEDLLRTAALRPGEHVVDVACGTGAVARGAAARVGPDGWVVGVDPSPDMLDVARSTAPHGAAVEWRQGSAEAIPLPDESFDYALCQLGVMFFSDRVAGLREIGRVLSPGGRIALNVPGPIPLLFRILEEALVGHGVGDLAKVVAMVFSLPDPEQVGALLQEAGFGDISVELMTRRLPLPPPADFLWQYVHASPLAPAVSHLGDEGWSDLERDVVGQWLPFVEDGVLVLELPVIVATGQA